MTTTGDYEQVARAQRDVHEVYVGGFFGQLASGAVWLLAAAVAAATSLGAGMAVLWIGGALIFPLTSLSLRLSGRPASLPPGHPMAGLAMQVAFTVPAGLLLALALAQYRAEWFFPASMVVVGAHYWPFVFLYGERLFAVLGAALVGLGVALALWGTATPDTTAGERGGRRPRRRGVPRDAGNDGGGRRAAREPDRRRRPAETYGRPVVGRHRHHVRARVRLDPARTRTGVACDVTGDRSGGPGRARPRRGR